MWGTLFDQRFGKCDRRTNLEENLKSTYNLSVIPPEVVAIIDLVPLNDEVTEGNHLIYELIHKALTEYVKSGKIIDEVNGVRKAIAEVEKNKLIIQQEAIRYLAGVFHGSESRAVPALKMPE